MAVCGVDGAASSAAFAREKDPRTADKHIRHRSARFNAGFIVWIWLLFEIWVPQMYARHAGKVRPKSFLINPVVEVTAQA